jgi:hypothetical protein
LPTQREWERSRRLLTCRNEFDPRSGVHEDSKLKSGA